jgi:hypothetical protein
MNLPEGVEIAMIIGVDDEGYLHVVSRLDTEQAVMLLEDTIDIIQEDTPESFTMQ